MRKGAGTPRLWPYALAYAGGVVAYQPLLGLLLPLRADAVAGAARDGLLTACAAAGAVAASLGGVLFGWLSDRSGGRRGWIAGGVAGTAFAYAALAAAAAPGQLLAAVLLFQLALNAMLGPLSAVMADEVPDRAKGTLAGLLATAPPTAAAVGAVLVAMPLGEAARLGAIPIVTVLLAVPLLLRPAPVVVTPAGVGPRAAASSRDLALAWAARFLVQAAGNAVALFLVYYLAGLEGRSPARVAGQAAWLLVAAALVPVPAALLIGRWSDRAGRRKPFLAGAAAAAAAGLGLMAVAGDAGVGAAGFVTYQLGFGVFVSLHVGFGFELLPSAATRGRDLGLLNLANTLPSLLGPAIAWGLARPDSMGTVMAALAALTAAGGALVLAIRGRA